MPNQRSIWRRMAEERVGDVRKSIEKKRKDMLGRGDIWQSPPNPQNAKEEGRKEERKSYLGEEAITKIQSAVSLPLLLFPLWSPLQSEGGGERGESQGKKFTANSNKTGFACSRLPVVLAAASKRKLFIFSKRMPSREWVIFACYLLRDQSGGWIQDCRTLLVPTSKCKMCMVPRRDQTFASNSFRRYDTKAHH